MAQKVQDDWNAAHGTVTIDGKTYPVEFEITGTAISGPEEAVELLANSSFEDNFIAVGDDPMVLPSGEYMNSSNTNGNTGWYNKSQNESSGGTTYSHEPIHGWGMKGHPDLDKNGEIKDVENNTDENGIVSIRIPSNATINGIRIDAKNRQVMQSDIDFLNIPGALNGEHIGQLGTIRDNISVFNTDGTLYDQVPKKQESTPTPILPPDNTQIGPVQENGQF
jgi:hypothetical protein